MKLQKGNITEDSDVQNDIRDLLMDVQSLAKKVDKIWRGYKDARVRKS